MFVYVLASLITISLGEIFSIVMATTPLVCVCACVCVEKVVQELKERRYGFDMGIQERMMTSFYASFAL